MIHASPSLTTLLLFKIHVYTMLWFHALKDDSLAKEMNNLFSILGINGVGLVNLPKDNFTKSFD